MASKRHLDHWREDADPSRVGGIVGREDERRLGEVHLARDSLHDLGLQAPAVEHHRKLIAGQRLLREDVHDPDLTGH